VIATRLQLARAFAPGAQLVDGSPLIPAAGAPVRGDRARAGTQNLLGRWSTWFEIETTENEGSRSCRRQDADMIARCQRRQRYSSRTRA
jgi:hypothetical protein